jgi:3D (Asp-Asp-Asp) domain-containing protein
VLRLAHRPRRRRLLPSVAIALAVLAAPAVGGANPSHSVASLRARDAAIAAQSRAAVLGLYALDSRLAAARRQLTSLQRQADSLRAQRASLRLQVRVAQRSTRLAQNRLADRVRALYDQGSVEPLEIVFGAKSLDEAMTSLDSLSRVAGQGEDVVRDLKLAKRDLALTARELRSRASELAVATHAANATLAGLERARSARASYISSLATQRQLTRREITNVEAAAHAAQVRSVSLQQTQTSAASVVRATVSSSPSAARAVPAAAGATLAPVVVAGGHTMTVSATGYSLAGRTSSGLPVGWGVVAVDPSVIPLGTHMTIPGYGEAVAADTGGSVVGATLDLWFPTVAQAYAWGRRTVTITLH